MDENKRRALRKHHQGLRTGILVGNILPALRPVLTDAEYSRIRDREDSTSRVDELIDVLLTKENRHFDALCTALHQNGYEHWAAKLQKVDEIEGLEVNAPPLSQTQVQFPIIDELADDFAILIASVNRKVHSLSASRLHGLRALFEEKLKSKGTPITIPSSADELINFISQYWDFLSFEFAQLVVRYLGKKDLQTQLKSYEEKLQKKAKILLTQCREKNITPRVPPGCFSMKITVDENPYSFSLHRILAFKDFLVHRIGMDMALFTGWGPGSIFLHFCILEDDMETAGRQLYVHELELRAMQVVTIEVGDIIVYRDAPIERPPSIAAVSRKIDDLAVAMETGGLAADDLHSHSPLSQGEGELMREVKTLKLELASVKEELQTARRDADHVRQEQRVMKDQLDHTIGGKRELEKQLEVQKNQAKEWKIQLNETIAKLRVKEEEVEVLQEQLRRREIYDWRTRLSAFEGSRVAASPSSPAAEISNPADVIEALNHRLDAQWRWFGTCLYVTPAFMDGISSDKSNVASCMLQLVEKWLYHENGTGDLPRTWETVVLAVKHTGQGRLAEQLEQRYGVSTARATAPSRVAASPSSPAAEILKPADVIEALDHRLDVQWREFGTFLHVAPAVLDFISQINSDVASCMLQLVEKWLCHDNGTGNLPRTWETVVLAVKRTGRELLAEQLVEQHRVQLPGQ